MLPVSETGRKARNDASRRPGESLVLMEKVFRKI